MRRDRAIVRRQRFDTPFPEMINGMGLAAAESQFELERVALRLARLMRGRCETEVYGPLLAEPECGPHQPYVTFNGRELSLGELGFTPSFQ